ncbi:MAG: BlaI/MecI/CopY family transcriptional regulator [Chlorobia bacterium]|nr:BlaI/MecI/CopY family transcriptional regulator [Fimbriimonadaceae bacterium]
MKGNEPKPTLGAQELSLLRHIENHPASSAGEVFASFGESNGLARSTVETVMERLRKKGYLKRKLEEGAFRYRTTVTSQELESGMVEQFVQNTLAGSLVPFVTYFSRQNRLSETEIAELSRLVAKLQQEESE